MAEVDDIARALSNGGMEPALAGVISARLVTLTGTQALTGKTLTSPTLAGNVIFGNGVDLVFNTGTGTKIGTGTTQKIGFFNSTPVVKPAALTAIDATAITAIYTSAEQGVVNNLRTRLNELEARLQALGLLT